MATSKTRIYEMSEKRSLILWRLGADLKDEYFNRYLYCPDKISAFPSDYLTIRRRFSRCISVRNWSKGIRDTG